MQRRPLICANGAALQGRDRGFIAEVRNAARLTQDIRANFERWAEVVKRTGFKAEA